MENPALINWLVYSTLQYNKWCLFKNKTKFIGVSNPPNIFVSVIAITEDICEEPRKNSI